MIDFVGEKDLSQLTPDQVLEIYRSSNQNLMSAESYPSQASEATVVGCQVNDKIRLFVHYFLYDDNVGLLYQEDEPISPNSYGAQRDFAVESVESLGFLMENFQFGQMTEQEKRESMAKLPVFGGHGRHVAELDSTTRMEDPETILILDDEPDPHDVAMPSLGRLEGIQLDQDSWKVLFRFIASF